MTAAGGTLRDDRNPTLCRSRIESFPNVAIYVDLLILFYEPHRPAPIILGRRILLADVLSQIPIELQKRRINRDGGLLLHRPSFDRRTFLAREIPSPLVHLLVRHYPIHYPRKAPPLQRQLPVLVHPTHRLAGQLIRHLGSRLLGFCLFLVMCHWFTSEIPQILMWRMFPCETITSLHNVNSDRNIPNCISAIDPLFAPRSGLRHTQQ